eukprot:scaffold237055_cov39-Prasinocladus_malaysianus.AAC.1
MDFEGATKHSNSTAEGRMTDNALTPGLQGLPAGWKELLVDAAALCSIAICQTENALPASEPGCCSQQRTSHGAVNYHFISTLCLMLSGSLKIGH